MKPYYRYNFPQKDILPNEIELWVQLKQNGGQQKEQLIDGLKVEFKIIFEFLDTKIC